MSETPPLAVRCPSCAARLRVTDRQLIGTTAQCPRCGGEVLIQLPQPKPVSKLQIGRGESVDSESLTQSSVANPADIVAPPVIPSLGPSDLPFSSHGSVTDQPAAPLPLDRSSVWQSESSRRTSQAVLVGLLAVFGLIAAGVTFTLFARSFATPSAVAVQNDPASTTNVTDPEALASPSDAEPAADPTATASTVGNTPSDAVVGEEIAGTDDPPVPLTDALINDAELRGDNVDDGAPIAGQPTADDRTGDVASTSPDTLAAQPAAAEPEFDLANSSLDNLPPALRKFMPLLDVSLSEDDDAAVAPAPPTIDTVRLDSAARLDSAGPAETRRPQVDIAKAMSLRVAIDQQGIRLTELALLVSQITAVPVEVELISLDLAGIGLDQPLTTPSGWLTVGDWLQQTLQPLGLATEAHDGCLVIHATAAKLLDAAAPALLLDDFGDQAATLADWLQPLVSTAPSPDGGASGAAASGATAATPWRWDPASGRLQVTEQRPVIVQAICAIETLRLQRGLPGRLPRWQTARWLGQWVADADPSRAIADWPPVREGQVGAAIDSPRTMAGLLRESGTLNQAHVVVAWPDAMRHQLYPTDLSLPYSDGLGMGDYLDELLGDSGLQVRDAGQSVWWVGSEGLYDRYEVITWVQLPAAQDDPSGTPTDQGERVARRLSEALGGVAIADLPLTWNQDVMLLRAPRYIARQLPKFTQP